jgi:D-glycero-D-manno-heptose 1,7-bisphosphate phosphatase
VVSAVFLDRDGVINRVLLRDGKPYPPFPVESFEIIEGVEEALQKLREAGFRLIVVTNQPDVARGKTPRESVERVHHEMAQRLAIDEIVTCYHDDGQCTCRKPAPGAIVDAAKRHDIDLASSFMVGDRWRDIEAGQRAGCGQCLFIDYGYREKQPNPPFERVASLSEAANFILNGRVTQGANA